MDRILKTIDGLWSELAIKLEESKDQKALNRIIKKLSKYASTIPCLPDCVSLTQHPRSLEGEDEKIKAMLDRGRWVRGARNRIDAEELASSCDAIKDALLSFLVSQSWSV